MESNSVPNRIVSIVGSPYGTLLIILLTTLIVYLFLGYFRLVNWILDFVLLCLAVSSLRIIHGKGPVYILAWILGISAFLFSFFGRSMGYDVAFPVGAGLRSLFMCYLIVIILKDCMHHEEVMINTIFGANCVCVLLGLAFGSTYALCEWVSPGAFSLPSVPASALTELGRSANEFSLAYFSFVALDHHGVWRHCPSGPSGSWYSDARGYARTTLSDHHHRTSGWARDRQSHTEIGCSQWKIHYQRYQLPWYG